MENEVKKRTPRREKTQNVDKTTRRPRTRMNNKNVRDKENTNIVQSTRRPRGKRN